MHREQVSFIPLGLVCALATALCSPVAISSPVSAQAKARATRPSGGQVHELPPGEPPPAELAQISPDSVPPGWSGEVVLGGKKFHDRLILHLWCRGTLQSTSTGIIKAQTPERAVTQLRIPGDWKAGDCVAFLDTSVTRVDFKVSGAPAGKAAGRGTGQAAASAATLMAGPARGAASTRAVFAAVEAPATLVGEGDMQLMEIVTTMRRSLAGSAKIQGVMRKGRLVVTPESIAFVQEGKAVFEEPTSSVREVSPIGRAGRPAGFFRIVFRNGKIYNFQDPKANSPERSSYLMLKKALGK